jgi:hypothetical protein
VIGPIVSGGISSTHFSSNMGNASVWRKIHPTRRQGS